MTSQFLTETSPTKARALLSQSRDWLYVSNFLSSQFAPRHPPPFERNPDTLKALLVLAQWNEDRNSSRDLLQNIQRDTLNDLNEEQRRLEENENASIISTLYRGLTSEGQDALEAMAQLSVLLSTSEGHDLSMLAAGLVELSRRECDLALQNQRVDSLLLRLRSEMKNSKEMLDQLQGETFKEPADLMQKTKERARGTKVLKEKLRDYEDKLAMTSDVEASDRPDGMTVMTVVSQEKEVASYRDKVAKLEEEVRSYHGLPFNADHARDEVDRTKRLLENMTKKRDAMFERLLDDDRR